MAEMEELEPSVQEAAVAAVEAPAEVEEMPAVPWPDTEVQEEEEEEEVVVKTEEPLPVESAVAAVPEVETAKEPVMVATGECRKPFLVCCHCRSNFDPLQTGFRSSCTPVSNECAQCACSFDHGRRKSS